MTASSQPIDWHQQADQLTIGGHAFIDGRYTDAGNGACFDCYSPIDGRLLSSVAHCDQADVDRAVTGARSAFASGIWSRAAPQERKKILQAFAAEILAHRNELALLETLDMGKPITDSLTDDMPGSADCIRWCAEAIDKWYGEVAPTADHILGTITYEPIGVVAAIVPWNYPLNMAAWKLGPALATGNSVILKPSEKSPLTAIRVAALAKQAGLPDGVLQVTPGFGETTGKALALHPDVDTVAFTGSTRTAKQLLGYAGASNLKQVWSEAGGKTPNIIFADAVDLAQAAKTAALAVFGNQGEVCTAGSRLLVEDSIYEEVVQRLLDEVDRWCPGHPLNPASTVGAMVDATQLKTVLDYIAIGQQEGAHLRVGGQSVHVTAGGYYLEPTIFTGVTNDMTIAQQEIFGPVLAVIPFTTEAEAIAIANDTIYGLAAALWTRDLGRAHRVARRLRAGSVWVNNYHGGDMTVPFGGYKQSGNGRDKSLHAFAKYTQVKTTWLVL